MAPFLDQLGRCTCNRGDLKQRLLHPLDSFPLLLQQLLFLSSLLCFHLLQLHLLALIDEPEDEGRQDASHGKNERLDEHLREAEDAAASDQSPGLVAPASLRSWCACAVTTGIQVVPSLSE